MIRFLAAAATAAAALSCATLAHAGATSRSASAEVRITDSGGIQVLTPLALPSVAVTALPGTLLGNAQLIIRAETHETLSMEMPSELTLVRTGGTEALTLDTISYGLAGQGVLLGGQMINGSAISVDVGGKLSMATSLHPVAGPYEGLFVVVVQYN